MAQVRISKEILAKATEARRELHKHAELSFLETGTAKRILEALYQLAPPDDIFTGVGGTGVVAVYNSGKPGPTVLFRAELDALPLQETNDFEHKSVTDGVSHKCGHDGHMATLLGLAGVIRSPQKSSNQDDVDAKGLPPTPLPAPILTSGKVVLVFQPAEEEGTGAVAVLADPNFTNAVPPPDYVFAYHNIPSFRTGTVVLRREVFTASVRR